MSEEDYPVEFVLDSIDAIMASEKQPKVMQVSLPRSTLFSSLIGSTDSLILEVFV
jgi:hypothetical protein